MPWPKEHKHRTRERIVEAAAESFRADGIAEVAVGDVMKRAGLTHGGFYAHFPSKDDLLVEALSRASAQSAEMLAGPLGATPDTGLIGTASAYLSPQHLAHPEVGCPIAALGPELARKAEPRLRRVLAEGIERRLERLRNLVSGRASGEKRRRDAAGTLACMVGGIILARGLKKSESDEFLEDCRAFLRHALARDDEEAKSG